jgi:hypothetical protein
MDSHSLQLEQPQSLRMPTHRHTRAQARLQSLGPVLGVESCQSSASPDVEDELFGTQLPKLFTMLAREELDELLKTEPSTPDSPLSRARGNNWKLRHEPSVHLFHIQAVLHFD